MKNLTLTDERVKTIQHKHMHAVDKLYRMHAGISSDLIAVKNGIAQLEVCIHPGWKKPHEVTIDQFITSWTNHISELKEIDGWQVKVYTSEKIAGFTISPDEINSRQLQRKINLMNANPEKSLIYIHRVYKDSIKNPILTLKDSGGKFNFEFASQIEVVKCGFLNIDIPQNYLVFNSNISGNLFIIPHSSDDYLLITAAENDELIEVKYLHASTTPVTFSFHSKLIYLINLSKEESARFLWQEFIKQPSETGVKIGTKNC